ncbi:MAG TPA: site-specific integrase [Minicystis sp.]|nr:site-specific integrase [Minicystis sp.]
MAAQPAEQAAQTKLHTYQRLRRLFDLAEYPCKLRPEGSNPIKKYLRPDRDPEKFYNFLYPSELLAVLGSKGIPLGRRVLYVLGCYCGLRKESLYSLLWSGVDLKHGTITVYKAKGKKRADGADGGRPLFFQADPSVMLVLRAWREHCGSPAPAERVLREVGCELRHDEAKMLREDLRAVGVTRELLFLDAANVEPLRFHDLRSTFVTWARRAGRSDAWIAERTGHLTQTMIDRYTRQAQTLADLNYEPFPNLVNAIPELTRRSSTQRASEDLGDAARSEGQGPSAPSAAENDNAGSHVLLEVLAGNTVGVQVPPFALIHSVRFRRPARAADARTGHPGDDRRRADDADVDVRTPCGPFDGERGRALRDTATVTRMSRGGARRPAALAPPAAHRGCCKPVAPRLLPRCAPGLLLGGGRPGTGVRVA